MQALILAGGSGTRFWPVSRRSKPKQLLTFGGEESLLQSTVRRLQPLVEADSVWVCTTSDQAVEVRNQLPEISPTQILEEPMGKNTALAIGWSVRSLPRAARDDVIVVLPADHHIGEVEGFQDSLRTAAAAAFEKGIIVTLGVLPTRAETGYGYLEIGEYLDEGKTIRRVVRFTEKPDLEDAKRFVRGGNYLWNAGIFVFRGEVLLERLQEHQPVLASGLEKIAASPEDLGEVYSSLPAISIDHGLMEKLDDLGTVPIDCGWTDLGSWEALWEHLGGDANGNVASGDVLSVDTKDCLVMSTDGLVAAIGVENLVIVRTQDAVLVVPKERSQEVRRIVQRLAASGRSEQL